MEFKRKNISGGEKVSRRPANLLALDFATSGVKAVRLRKVKDRITLVAADVLPPRAEDNPSAPDIPKALGAYYAALCASMDHVILRVFNYTLPEENEDVEAVVRETLSVGEDYRVGGVVLSRARGKKDSSLLGVAVLENTVQHYLSLFARGAPAPHSLEISGLAAFSAFLFNRGDQTADQMICLIESGARHTYAAFFHRNQLQIISRFDLGVSTLMQQIQSSLGVDAETARAILAGGAVDVSSQVRQVMASFTKQLSIYREFVERQNKSQLSAVYVSGGQSASPYWQTAIKEVLGIAPQTWSPFEKIEILPEAFPEIYKGQESRFAAAVGAALAGMEVE